MDITISLEQRHVDALYAAAKVDFATDKIVEFIDAHASDCDLLCAEKAAREEAAKKISEQKKPSVKR